MWSLILQAAVPPETPMRVFFSTDGLPPRDRVKFWCDFFAQQAHHFTPGEVRDASAFEAEAYGQAALGFVLLDIQSGLDSLRRTGADVARDKTKAFFVRRFRRAAVWKVAPRSAPLALVFEPGDFCTSSSEWQFEEESNGASFMLLVIPHAALSPLLPTGRLARPFRLPAASPLG